MKREGTVHAWRIYYHHLQWNTVANHLVQHSVCKITSVWPWNLCIEGFYNWSSHTGWWEQPQRHCSLLVTGHDGDLPWLILPAQSLCQQGSQATSCSSNFQRGLACQTSKVKHKSLNLLKVLETITFTFVVSSCMWAVTADHQGWEFKRCSTLDLLVSPWASHFPARNFIHCWAQISSLSFREQFHWCSTLFSPFTCNSCNIYLKRTSDSNIRV